MFFPIILTKYLTHCTVGKSVTTAQNLAFRCKEMMRSKKSGGTLKSNLGIHASTNSKEVFRSFPRPILEMEHYTKIQASTPRDLLRKQSRFYKQYNSSICEKKSIRYHKIPPRAITCWDCLNTVSTAYTACTAFTAFTADQGGRSCAFQKGLRRKV